MGDTTNSSNNTLAEECPKQKTLSRDCRSACAQMLAAVIQALLLVDIGMEVTIPTLIIGALHRNNSAATLRMNDDEASWFGSISYLVNPFATFSSGFLQEMLGRKGSMMYVNIPRFAGWMTLYFAESIPALYIAAVTMGLSSGLCEASVHSYLGEIGDPRLRGTLASVSSHGYFIGVLATFILGYYFEWRTVVLINSMCPILTFICIAQIPESPTWLIVRNRLDEAKRSLSWVRGWVPPNQVDEEFQEMVNYVKKSSAESWKALNSENSSVFKRGIVMTKAMTNKKMLRPLCMTFLVFLNSAICCIYAMNPFLIRELKDLGTTVEPKLLLVMFQSMLLTGSIFNVVFLRRFGKRKLALYSVGLATLCIIGIGTFCSFSFGGSTKRNPQLSWIPVSLFCVLNFINGLGIRLLPWQLISEIFPPVGRGLASGISVAFSRLNYTILVKSFLYMEAWLHLSGVLYVYGGIALMGLLYFYFYLPETEGKTLEQIESYFTKNHDRAEKFKIGRRE